MKFIPFPEIQTDRLLLRRINESDCDEILFLRSDEAVNKYILRKESDKTKTKVDALKFIQRIDGGLETKDFISWGITIKVDPKIIGTICLWNFSKDRKKAEVGYDLNPKFHGKGIMSEALQKVLNFGFKNLDLLKISAHTHEENVGSRKLLEKNGFILMEGVKEEEYSWNVIYEIGV